MSRRRVIVTDVIHRQVVYPQGAPQARAGRYRAAPSAPAGHNPYEHAVLNPPLPYIGQLLAMSDGFMVAIQGNCPVGAGRFHFNLATDAMLNGKCDIALHFNPRFEGMNRIIRNTFHGGRWGNEENTGPPFPFQQGQNFECIILVTNDCYKIAVNGVHYCEFRHRLPKESATHLVIEGNVTIQSIRYQGTGVTPQSMQSIVDQMHNVQLQQPPSYKSAGQHPPAPAYGFQGPGAPPAFTPSPVVPPAFQAPPQMAATPGFTPGAPLPAGYGPPQNLVMPYKQLFQGLPAGRMIYISGTPVMPKPSQPTFRFTINFKLNDTPKSDIAFHFQARMRMKKVVRNTFVGGNWGREEKDHSVFPFNAGVPFDIIIQVEQDRFKVAVNNSHFIDYVHRLRNLANINFLEINGDLNLTNVRVQ